MTTSTSLLRSFISIFAALAVAFGNMVAAASPNVAGIASSPVEPIQHPQSATLAPALLSGASVGVPKTAGHAVYSLPSTDPFTDTGAALTGVFVSSVAWGDYDNDGDLDILLTGSAGSSRISKVYRNDGGGVFTDINAGLTGVDTSSVAWGDYDNDGDLDILLTGSADSSAISKVYRNDGNGVFTDIGAALTGVFDSSVAWGDYDNDGRLDILLTGATNSGYIAKLYHNDSNGIFTDIGAALTGVSYSSVAWGDYDNDGDLDILLTGDTAGGSPISKVYRNDGGGFFTDIGAALTGVEASSVAWGDYDNDGKLDILLTGSAASGSRISKVYRNDGGGVFTDIGAALTGVGSSSVAWGDYDNDGDLDILLTGDSDSGPVAKIFRNDGNGVFTDINAGLTDVDMSSVAWGDYDNDGKLDILLTGFHSSGNRVAKIYCNNATTANTVPTTPSNLAASVADRNVTLSWSAASDSQTPASGLTYNLRVGTTPGGTQVVAPMAADTGYRRIPQLGNAEHGLSATIKNLSYYGKYYWSVQAVDTAWAGSPFASSGGFTLTTGTSADITVSPSSLAATLDPGGMTTFTLTIGNVGSADLIWSLAENPTVTWLSESPTSGTVALGNSVQVSVTFNTSGLANGTYTTTLQITSNDPDEPQVGVPVTVATTAFTDIGAAGCGGGGAWGDYDNDGKLDIVTPGGIICHNNGNGTFTDINAGLPGVSGGSVAWGDYDNDGRLDILLTGCPSGGCSAAITKLYHNNGNGTFTDIGTALANAYGGSTAWGDYNNDGKQDILLTGSSTDGSPISRVYRNDGNGVFTDIGAALPNWEHGFAVWGDYNNDGKLDILLTEGDYFLAPPMSAGMTGMMSLPTCARCPVARIVVRPGVTMITTATWTSC